jgi:hypothetical protein
MIFIEVPSFFSPKAVRTTLVALHFSAALKIKRDWLDIRPHLPSAFA